MKGSLKFIGNHKYSFFVTIFCLLCYCSMLVPSTVFWPASIIGVFVPVIMFFSAVVFLLLLFINRRLIVFPIVVLIFSIPFLLITVKLSDKTSVKVGDLSVLSFNTKFFRKENVYNEFSIEMIEWVKMDTSGVKCVQEYSTDSKWEPLDITKNIEDRGYQSFAFSSMESEDHNLGLAIFSKYNIVDSGYVWKNQESFHGGIFIDIEYMNRIIRVYNVHMASTQFSNSENMNGNFFGFLSRIKNGAIKRTEQTNVLLKHIENCPYPFIICGDFNEAPYGTNYRKVKHYVSNAFEKAGRGFGFTLNSYLFFLRIDHQFFSSPLEALSFSVEREVKFSDHFPTKGIYRFVEE